MVRLIRFNWSKTRVNPLRKYSFLVMNLLAKVMAVSMSSFEMPSYHRKSISIVHRKIRWKILQLYFVLLALRVFRKQYNWRRTTFGLQWHFYQCEYDCGDRNYHRLWGPVHKLCHAKIVLFQTLIPFCPGKRISVTRALHHSLPFLSDIIYERPLCINLSHY